MDNKNFQTPADIIEFMSLLIPMGTETILEPTPGAGRIVRHLRQTYEVTAPKDFYKMKPRRRKFDCAVMNPPFTPMQLGYDILFACMELTDNVIALMPWLTLINGEKRLDKIMQYGLVRVIHLPRSIFPGARVQTCILEMERGHKSDTVFDVYKKE